MFKKLCKSYGIFSFGKWPPTNDVHKDVQKFWAIFPVVADGFWWSEGGGIFLVRPHLRTANLLFSLYIKFSNYCLASVTLLSSCNFFGRTCFKDSSFFLTPTVAASVCSDNVINNFEFVIACEILILRYYSFGIFCSNFDILSIDEVCFWFSYTLFFTCLLGWRYRHLTKWTHFWTQLENKNWWCKSSVPHLQVSYRILHVCILKLSPTHRYLPICYQQLYFYSKKFLPVPS